MFNYDQDKIAITSFYDKMKLLNSIDCDPFGLIDESWKEIETPQEIAITKVEAPQELTITKVETPQEISTVTPSLLRYYYNFLSK